MCLRDLSLSHRHAPLPWRYDVLFDMRFDLSSPPQFLVHHDILQRQRQIVSMLSKLGLVMDFRTRRMQFQFRRR